SELLGSGGVRLVTVTGPAEVGRADVAVAAAARLAGGFPDGVWYVDLSAVERTPLVLPAIARALGAGEPDRLTEDLRSRQLLLVLDPFEHLSAAAGALSDLLRRAPRLKLLVVGGSRLRLYGEHVFDHSP
ncbi:MAG: hypothetical protein ACRDNB_01335, partial [Gaiellaceae bacterium]